MGLQSNGGLATLDMFKGRVPPKTAKRPSFHDQPSTKKTKASNMSHLDALQIIWPQKTIIHQRILQNGKLSYMHILKMKTIGQFQPFPKEISWNLIETCNPIKIINSLHPQFKEPFQFVDLPQGQKSHPTTITISEPIELVQKCLSQYDFKEHGLLVLASALTSIICSSSHRPSNIQH